MTLIKYFRSVIQRNMEDPAERDRKWEAHLNGVVASAAAAKANMAQPTKAWGFWREGKHTAKYEQNADPAVAKLPGRRKPNLAE